jgi:malate dehydrogenase (quinone)
MLDVASRIYPDRFQAWKPEIKKLVPSFGVELNSDPKLAADSLSKTAKTLKLKA